MTEEDKPQQHRRYGCQYDGEPSDCKVYGRQAMNQTQPISGFVGSGYEEVHEVEPGCCVHITDALVMRDWRLTARSLEHALRLRVAFSGEADYSARDSGRYAMQALYAPSSFSPRMNPSVQPSRATPRIAIVL